MIIIQYYKVNKFLHSTECPENNEIVQKQISLKYALQLMYADINTQLLLKTLSSVALVSLYWSPCHSPELRSAARLIGRVSKFDHISAYMRDVLHWLPLRQRIEFRVAVLVWYSLIGQAPAYLTD